MLRMQLSRMISPEEIFPEDDKVLDNNPILDSSMSRIEVSLFLSLKDNQERLLYYDFLRDQSSDKVILFATTILVIAFGTVQAAVAFSDNMEYPFLTGFARVFRSVFTLFACLYCFLTTRKKVIKYTHYFWDLRNPVVVGNIIILTNAMSSGVLLCVRCWIGACDDKQSYRLECNPVAEENIFPFDTFISHIFMIILLPILFKVHDRSAVGISWVIGVIGFCLSSHYVKASISDITTLSLAFVGVGGILYETERGWLCLFLTLIENRSYYQKLLDMERTHSAIEIEKDNLRNLIGNVAHDLKTPLQAFMSELSGLQIEVDIISTQLQTSNDELSSGPHTSTKSSIGRNVLEVKKYVNSIRDIYQFMMMAINRAIDFRKATAGLTLLPSKETFELLPTVNWAVSKLGTNGNGVVVNVEVHPSCHEVCPLVISDKHWLCENILCMGSNACKFTSEGSVTIRCSIVTNASRSETTTDTQWHETFRQKSCSISSVGGASDSPGAGIAHLCALECLFSPFSIAHGSEANKCFVLIEVEDSGIGVPDSKRDMLFQMFGQAQRRAGGTGLGLFSLHKRMEALGGRCGMCDCKDGSSGARFWFCFPYVPDAKSHLQLSTRDKTGLYGTSPFDRSDPVDCRDMGSLYGTCSGRVLLVDDSALIQKTTSRMLEKLGYEVSIAQNGFEALKLMKEYVYVFILTDIQMPVMDGIEATQRMRAHEDKFRNEGVSSPPQTIIGMSADSDAETKRLALESGMNAFLSKPVHANELLNCISQIAE
jgi:CheY-like chemotaxis protein